MSCTAKRSARRAQLRGALVIASTIPLRGRWAAKQTNERLALLRDGLPPEQRGAFNLALAAELRKHDIASAAQAALRKVL